MHILITMVDFTTWLHTLAATYNAKLSNKDCSCVRKKSTCHSGACNRDGYDILCLLLNSEFHSRKINIPVPVAQFPVNKYYFYLFFLFLVFIVLMIYVSLTKFIYLFFCCWLFS